MLWKKHTEITIVILLENSQPHGKTVPKGLDLQGQDAVVVVIRRTIADPEEWKDSEKVLCATSHKEDVWAEGCLMLELETKDLK